MRGILGRKVGMTRVFDERGEAVPVTVIEAGPCYVTQVKTPERDGYAALQLGYEEVPARKLTKPQAGHLGKLPPLRVLRELRTSRAAEYKVGDRLTVEVFSTGDVVDVTGITKGKGFQGGMKRHGFRGQPKTHGQSDRWRAPGSIGAGTTPGRVEKGTRMAGRTGGERVTVQNLVVAGTDPERNLILLHGSVPGPNGGLVIVREAIKVRRRARPGEPA